LRRSETLAAELWPEAASAVVTQPDPRRGERLVLVTEQKAATRAAFQAHARTKGASDLMVPAEVIVVDKLPLFKFQRDCAAGRMSVLLKSSPLNSNAVRAFFAIA
jgi:acyl-[acyl-carrier-protein]-phospholipid O-acyltransferase/long-chain-fatty-acid--[acyl-carrier-protein] ligase